MTDRERICLEFAFNFGDRVLYLPEQTLLVGIPIKAIRMREIAENLYPEYLLDGSRGDIGGNSWYNVCWVKSYNSAIQNVMKDDYWILEGIINGSIQYEVK